ncbi:Transmembrane protein 97, partial [Linderina macrospora]
MTTLDTIYTAYFASHIPITLAVDIMPLLPRTLVPAPLLMLNTFLTQTLRDPFMVIDDQRTDLAWFRSFLVCELVFQLPFFFYALQLLRDRSPSRHPWLVMYGAHVTTTMVPILASLLFS